MGNSGNSSLWFASQAGRCREVEALLPEKFNQATLQRALHVAVANDHAGVVHILVRAGAVINNSGRHVLAALRCDSGNVLRTLVEAKASVNGDRYHLQRERYTVIAAEYGATKCLQVLAVAKADVTLPDDYYETPLGAAAQRGWVDTVHLLVQAKSDIDAVQRSETPALRAARSGHVHVLNLLIRAKANATRCTNYVNASPLFFAAAGGNAAVVCCLLTHAPALAAVVTQHDTVYMGICVLAGSTPLDVARLFRHDAVVALLVAARSPILHTEQQASAARAMQRCPFLP